VYIVLLCVLLYVWLSRDSVSDTHRVYFASSLIYNGFSVAGTRALAGVLTNNPTITSLNFQFNEIGDAGACLLAEALRLSCSLTSLHLGNNDIGPRGAGALAAALPRHASLRTLLLPNNPILDQGARMLAEALAGGACCCCPLLELDVAGNSIGCQGISDLAEALRLDQSRLRFLSLQGNCPQEGGLRRLAGALHHNTSLVGLDLGACHVSDSGAAALAEMLGHNHTLTGLQLDGNDIGDEGAAALAEGLRGKVTVLRRLDLSGNLFGAGGVAALAEGLRFSESLRELHGAALLPLACSVLRLSASELRRVRLDLQGEGEEEEDVGNARLLRAVRETRELRRLAHELGKEVVWGGGSRADAS
jgi:Ran GTPase-activating protein (RanGAP) involved in mRNA processing and transport